jgi:F-type H+-transporting ATPase subunit b
MTTYPNVTISSIVLLAEGETTAGETTATTEEHHKANNFFYGDINEVIWGSLAFLIILGLYLWKGLAPTKRALAKRTQRVADQISQAENTRASAEADLNTVRTNLGNADEEAVRIVADARERSVIVRHDLIARADTEVAEAKNRARIEIEASKSQALADLRAEVVAMTLRATEAVVSSNLDDSVRSQLVDQYIDQVGTAR